MRAILLSSMVLAGCADEGSPICPDGWAEVSATASCEPPEGYVEELQARLGNGYYGTVRLSTGDCSLVVDSVPLVPFVGEDERDCALSLVPSHLIEVYDATDLQPDPVEPHLMVVRPGATPLAATLTSDDGVYEIGVAAGRYAIATIDPIDGRWMTNVITLDEATVTWWWIHFKHSAD